MPKIKAVQALNISVGLVLMEAELSMIYYEDINQAIVKIKL